MTDAPVGVEGAYRIRPLKWKRSFDDYQQVWESDSAHGSYQVVRTRGDCEKHENCNEDSHGDWQAWRWEYCFAEYYDESSIECATAKEGKQAAEARWQEYIKAALEPVKVDHQ